jgi:hypothetical protein
MQHKFIIVFCSIQVALPKVTKISRATVAATGIWRESVIDFVNVNATLRFDYTGDVGLAFSPSDAISIEIFPSFQIAIAGDSDNI